MKKGEMEFRTSSTSLACVKWMDNKSVFLLSNFHDPSETSDVNRRQKDGTNAVIFAPVMVKDYNMHMGYVDKADMLKSYYEIDRKSKKWWHRIFWHFVDVCVTNAFIIYKEKKYDSLTLKKFRLQIVDALLRATIPVKQGRKSLPTPPTSHKANVSAEKRLAPGPHLPIALPQTRRHRCALCSTDKNEKRTRWSCKFCEVPLYLCTEKNCFLKFHSK